MKESANFSMWSWLVAVTRIEWIDHKFRSLSDLLMLRTVEAAPRRCFATRASVMKTHPLDLCLNTAIGLAAGTLRRTTRPIIRIAASTGKKWQLVGVTGKFYRVTVCSVFLFTPEDLHMLDLDVGCIVMQATLVSVEVSNHQSDTGSTSTRLVWITKVIPSQTYMRWVLITKVIPSRPLQDGFESKKWSQHQTDFNHWSDTISTSMR